MSIKKFYGYIIRERDLKFIHKSLDDNYNPPTMESKNWRQWITNATHATCWRCENLEGKIYSTYDTDFEEPPLHLYCRCVTIALKSTTAGNATKDGENGADFWIKYYGKLPDYYISGEELELLGWKWGKSPRKFGTGQNDN